VDAVSILRAQLKQGHDLVEFSMQGMTPEQLHYVHDGATIQSIAAIYAHVVIGEDQLINGFLRHQPSLFESGGWPERVGFEFTGDGEISVQLTEAVREVNIDALREYAQLVYAQTDDYLAGLSEADLDPMVTFGEMGDMPVGIFLGSVIVWHFAAHGAEIAALKGVLGGQGLPF
jgi:hypothetical protein